MTMTDEKYEQRLAELRAQTANVDFVGGEYMRLCDLACAVAAHIEDIDPYILGLDDERVQELVTTLAAEGAGDRVTRQLTLLDMFDLEKLSLTAEGYYADLGGQAELHMSADDLTALTHSLRQMRQLFFPSSREGANG